MKNSRSQIASLMSRTSKSLVSFYTMSKTILILLTLSAATVSQTLVATIGATFSVALQSPYSSLSFSLVHELGVLCVDSHSRKYCCVAVLVRHIDIWLLMEEPGLLCNLGLDVRWGLPASQWGQCGSNRCGDCVQCWIKALKFEETRNVLAVTFWFLRCVFFVFWTHISSVFRTSQNTSKLLVW